MDANRSQRAAERFQMALALYDLGEQMLRQKLLRKHPQASPAEIEALLAAWREHRPGAELGDGEGRPIPWPPERCG
jgi:hypothetical protein